MDGLHCVFSGRGAGAMEGMPGMSPLVAHTVSPQTPVGWTSSSPGPNPKGPVTRASPPPQDCHYLSSMKKLLEQPPERDQGGPCFPQWPKYLQ